MSTHSNPGTVTFLPGTVTQIETAMTQAAADAALLKELREALHDIEQVLDDLEHVDVTRTRWGVQDFIDTAASKLRLAGEILGLLGGDAA